MYMKYNQLILNILNILDDCLDKNPKFKPYANIVKKIIKLNQVAGEKKIRYKKKRTTKKRASDKKRKSVRRHK